MDIVTIKYSEIERCNDIKTKEPFTFIINGKRIELSKYISIMISDLVHDEYLRDSSVKSVNKCLNLSCNNTIDVISEFFKTGILRYENKQELYRDIIEVAKTFRIRFLTDKFCEFVMSTYKEINEENFIDIYDCSAIQNNENKMNECISFFASRMFDLKEEYKIKTIKRCGYDFFERVLTSKSLKIANEDSLVNTIMSLSEYDNSFFSLLMHVRVEYCNNDAIKSIKNFSVKHNLESISNEVFERALLNRSQIHHKLQHSGVSYFALDAYPSKLKYSNIEELHHIDKSHENMRKLRSLRKSKDDFKQIYEALKNASDEGDLSTIKFAVDEKYTDVRDAENKNMILEAAWNNNLTLLKHLLICGADIKSRSHSNRTVLHYFCQMGNLEGIKYVLNYIDINVKNDKNYTPLNDAIENSIGNCEEICEYLSSQPNIDKSSKNSDNETPLQCAVRLGKQKIAEILQRNGFTE